MIRSNDLKFTELESTIGQLGSVGMLRGIVGFLAKWANEPQWCRFKLTLEKALLPEIGNGL
jgi:hypothetical protein